MRYVAVPTSADMDDNGKVGEKDGSSGRRMRWWMTFVITGVAIIGAVSVLAARVSNEKPPAVYADNDDSEITVTDNMTLAEDNNDESDVHNVQNMNEKEGNLTANSRLQESRFSVRGLPLVDKWLPSVWQVGAPRLQALLNTIGFPSGDAKCSLDEILPTPSQSVVITTFQLKGFGSNILGIINDMFYAHVANKKFMLLSRRYQTIDSNETAKIVGYSNEYEKHFTFSVDQDTTCTNFGEICYEKPGEVSVEKRFCWGPTTLLYKDQRFIHQMRSDMTYYLAVRTELTRVLTRLVPQTREKVDASIKDVPLDNNSLDAGDYTIAIHVRRGDKAREAGATSSAHYARVALAAVQHQQARGPNSRLRQLKALVVVTDDAVAGNEVIALFDKFAKSSHENVTTVVPSMGYFVRNSAANDRPDMSMEIDPDSGFIAMLGDLKLTVLATVFVGTQTSNFGTIACYLRGGNACYNAEAKAKPFVWNQRQDKPA